MIRRRSKVDLVDFTVLLLRRFYVLFCSYVYNVYLGVKEIYSSYLDLLK